MYPQANIENMIKGYKKATRKAEHIRAKQIKKFLLDRKVILNDDFTYTRKH